MWTAETGFAKTQERAEWHRHKNIWQSWLSFSLTQTGRDDFKEGDGGPFSWQVLKKEKEKNKPNLLLERDPELK